MLRCKILKTKLLYCCQKRVANVKKIIRLGYNSITVYIRVEGNNNLEFVY